MSADLERSQEAMKEIKSELQLIKDVEEARRTMSDRFKALFEGITTDIDSATAESISQVIEQRLGLKDGEVGFILERDINQILQDCSEANNLQVSSVHVDKLEELFESQNKLMQQMVKQGGKALGKVKLSGGMIKSARNVVAKGFKFKPWGPSSWQRT